MVLDAESQKDRELCAKLQSYGRNNLAAQSGQHFGQHWI